MRYWGLIFSSGWILGIVLALSACSLTPDARSPAYVEQVGNKSAFDSRFEATGERPVGAGWWKQIGGSELYSLVAVLRQDSFALKESRAQLKQSLERARQAGGRRLPSVSANLDAARLRNPDGRGGGNSSNAYTADLIGSWDLDVLGGLRASARAASLNAEASHLNYLAAEQREVASLTRNWISAATLLRRQQLAQLIASIFTETYNLTRQRYRAGSGGVTASEVQIARQNLDAALVDIPDLEAQLRTQLIAIDLQLGRLPGQSIAEFEGAWRLDPTLSIPVGTPARLLAARPDVAAAELRYRAALEDVGAARADLYPALSLGASLSFQDDAASDLFSWSHHISRLAGSLMAPVFRGGQLRSAVRLQQAEAEELAASFARTTATAMSDVESALTRIEGVREQLRRQTETVKTAELADELSQTRYRQGLISILSILETQRSLNTARQNLLLIEQQLANAQVDLFLALGGTWFPQKTTEPGSSNGEPSP